MIKKIPSLLLGALFLSACTFGLPAAHVEDAEYALTNQDPAYPTILALKSDGTFTLDFNMCEGMNKGSGTYTVSGNSYVLDLEACTDCIEKENLFTELPTVTVELEKISETELKVKGEVLRTSASGEKYGFCELSDDRNEFKLQEPIESTTGSNILN